MIGLIDFVFSIKEIDERKDKKSSNASGKQSQPSTKAGVVHGWVLEIGVSFGGGKFRYSVDQAHRGVLR